jgi:hypothetical protein
MGMTQARRVIVAAVDDRASRRFQPVRLEMPVDFFEQAAASTKNADQARDPEMRQTRGANGILA